MGDIDELTAEQIAAIQLVSPEEAFADVPGLKSTVAEFKDWVSKQVKRIKPQGFGAPVIAGELFTGDRVDALIKQLEKNRYVLDASWTGDGKSHAIVPLAKASFASTGNIASRAGNQDLSDFPFLPTTHGGGFNRHSSYAHPPWRPVFSPWGARGSC
ncbi:hypothetical protein NON20_24505 (plasmid) [Synechocystis sp. B12]|nr:hypothetical protein NON20_24505 [Synechocystis sp. B12]